MMFRSCGHFQSGIFEFGTRAHVRFVISIAVPKVSRTNQKTKSTHIGRNLVRNENREMLR
jgi:hypothetical protein